MKNKSIFGILLFAFILSFTLLGCSPEGVSKVTITIDLGLGNKSAFNTPESSILDRVLRFFAKDAEAAPSNITSLTLNITGSGMDTITQSYTTLPLPDTITVEVPSGNSRTFEVLAYTPSATLRGATTRNLTGGTVTIPVTMGLYETKIIVPDYMNSRIVQIDDMDGNGWIEKNASNLTSPSSISYCRPYDIDFDSNGRIYICNPGATAGPPKMFRLNHINNTSNSWELILNDSNPDVYAIAIDRNLSYIYYATTSALYRCNLDGTGISPLTFTSIGTISGLAVDSDGILYISHHAAGAPVSQISKYNPSSESEITFNDDTITMKTAMHVLVKPPYLYVANLTSSGTDNQILQLDLNTLALIHGYGTYALSTTQGSFYGASHFVAILNRKITIVDEASLGNNSSKLINMDDIAGSNWGTYGIYGSGVGMFDFYHVC
ncbi:MAG: hypothetical protein V1874_07765 [Spirochaetota bacterium]